MISEVLMTVSLSSGATMTVSREDGQFWVRLLPPYMNEVYCDRFDTLGEALEQIRIQTLADLE